MFRLLHLIDEGIKKQVDRKGELTAVHKSVAKDLITEDRRNQRRNILLS